MITLEKDAKAEEIFIQASPEDLREFAKRLWAISEKGEQKGKHSETLTAGKGADPELSPRPAGNSRTHSVVKKLTVSCKTS